MARSERGIARRIGCLATAAAALLLVVAGDHPAARAADGPDCHAAPISAGRFLVIVIDLESGDRCQFVAPAFSTIGDSLGLVLHADQSTPMHSILREPARRSGVPFAFMAAVMMAESGGNPFAVGDGGSSIGLFQLHEAGLGASVLQFRGDPSVSAGIAARALAEGWGEGVRRGLAGDELARFAYGYLYNPGGEYGPQGDKIAAYFRYYSGRPRALGDPTLPTDGLLEDAAEVNVDGVDYFVIAFRKGSVTPESLTLENALVTVPARRSTAAASVEGADGDWLLAVAVASPTLAAIGLWAFRHRRTGPLAGDEQPAVDSTA